MREIILNCVCGSKFGRSWASTKDIKRVIQSISLEIHFLILFELCKQCAALWQLQFFNNIDIENLRPPCWSKSRFRNCFKQTAVIR